MAQGEAGAGLLASTMRGRTVGDAFDPRHNALNAIRLALALLVVVSHTWPTGGYGDDPKLGDQDLGNWAVAGFFGISGYLITASRLHSRNLVDYLWRRVLRIYPAFLVVIVVIAFVVSPIVAGVTGDGEWSPVHAVSFVLHNAALEIRQYGIGSTLTSVPYPNVWDGSLWTLFFEFLCYIAVGVAATVLPRQMIMPAVAVALIVCAGATVGFEYTSLSAPTTIKYLLLLGGYFAGGALLYLLRDKIPHSVALVIVSIILLVVLAWFGVSRPFAGFPVAYLMIFAGSRMPQSLQRVGAKNDISYGMYIYAFPVQQVLAYVFPAQMLPALVFALIAIACTLPLAWASWLFVERPALRFKDLSRRFGRRTVAAA